jgi:hypothetical protein
MEPLLNPKHEGQTDGHNNGVRDTGIRPGIVFVRFTESHPEDGGRISKTAPINYW